MRQKIIDWLVNNEPTIRVICEPLMADKNRALQTFAKEYHDDVLDQYKTLVLKGVCDSVCEDLGCSAEDFYETIEGTEDKWILLTLD